MCTSSTGHGRRSSMRRSSDGPAPAWDQLPRYPWTTSSPSCTFRSRLARRMPPSDEMHELHSGEKLRDDLPDDNGGIPCRLERFATPGEQQREIGAKGIAAEQPVLARADELLKRHLVGAEVP